MQVEIWSAKREGSLRSSRPGCASSLAISVPCVGHRRSCGPGLQRSTFVLPALDRASLLLGRIRRGSGPRPLRHHVARGCPRLLSLGVHRLSNSGARDVPAAAARTAGTNIGLTLAPATAVAVSERGSTLWHFALAAAVSALSSFHGEREKQSPYPRAVRRSRPSAGDRVLVATSPPLRLREMRMGAVACLVDLLFQSARADASSARRSKGCRGTRRSSDRIACGVPVRRVMGPALRRVMGPGRRSEQPV